jgi:hypothetical protein
LPALGELWRIEAPGFPINVSIHRNNVSGANELRRDGEGNAKGLIKIQRSHTTKLRISQVRNFRQEQGLRAGLFSAFAQADRGGEP